jgi:hypothetical protein
VKKLIGLGLLLLVACQRKVEVSSPSPSSSAAATGQPGAATTNAAIAAFMTAAKSEDLQAIGNYWGTTSGPAREQMSRSEFEMRAFYIAKCVRHDSYQVLSESGAANGQRVASVQIRRGSVTKTTNFTLVQGPQARWYVFNLELEPLSQICNSA